MTDAKWNPAGIREGDLVRVSDGHTKPGTNIRPTYRVYGLWPRGSVSIREVEGFVIDNFESPTEWYSVSPERIREVPLSWVEKRDVAEGGK